MPVQHSLADTVRDFDVTRLAGLLARRPDLARPTPMDLDELVERASSQASTNRALESLDAWTLQCARGMAALEVGGVDFDAERLARGLGLPDEAGSVRAAVSELESLALCWGDPPHLTHAARAAFGSHPAGLAGASVEVMSADTITTALEAVGPAGRELLDKLVWGPPTGAVHHADRAVTPDSAETTIDLLLTHRLLRPTGPEQVILPREVSLLLRGGRLVLTPAPPAAPDLGHSSGRLGADLPVDLVNRAAVGSAQELVSHVVAVLDDLGTRTPRRLSVGGVPRKEMTRLTRLVGDPFVADFAVALARGTGMLVEQGPILAATTAFDAFLEEDSFRRWARLSSAWTQLSWWPQAADPRRSAALRAAAGAELAGAAAGTALDAEGLAARLAWQHPSWTGVEWADVAAELLREAELLGMVAFGRTTVLTTTTGRDPDPGFAPFGSTLILQSDLTAVAPAPLDHLTDRAAGTIANRESHGATATFRFTEDSLRAAFDAGWSSETLIGWLHEHDAAGMQAPLPPPLVSLIEDTARHHGQLRVMVVTAVVQVDDEAVAASLLADRAAPQLGLTALAPGFLSATAEPEDIVAFLRRRGLAPVAQDAEGEVFTTPPVHRAAPPVAAASEATVDTELLAARLIRRRGRGMGPDAILAALAEAHDGDRWITLDWADDDGTAHTNSIRVLSLGSGVAQLVRRGAGRLNLPLSRIIAVHSGESA